MLPLLRRLLMITYELTTIYLPMIIAGIFVLTIILLWTLDTWEGYKTISALTALWYMSRVEPIWMDASILMWYEVLMFGYMWLFLKTFWGGVISILTVVMAVNNALYVMYGGYDLHRLSLVSLIFVIQCVICIGVSYHTHYERGKESGKGHGNWYALQGFLLSVQRMAGRS